MAPMVLTCAGCGEQFTVAYPAWARKRRYCSSACTGRVNAGDPVLRIAERVVVTEGGCWTFTGWLHRGYGMMSFRGRNRSTHRLMWESLGGEPAEHLHHLCRNRACCNPEHLEPLNAADHIAAEARVVRKRAPQSALGGTCKRGHPYDEENTYYWTSTGRRACRACRRLLERTKKGKAAA